MTADAARPGPPPRARDWPPAFWIGYVLLWAAIGLFLSIPALQDYRLKAGSLDWEPFLWEYSSVISTALLGLAVYRWTHWQLQARRPWWAIVAAQGAGVLLFCLLHIAMMYGLREAVYLVLGMTYQYGTWQGVLRYEFAKDVVTYLLLSGMSVLLVRERRARAGELAVERLRSDLADARLAALKQQVHPHFLFNTLNLVSALMYEDPAKADQVISQLAALLRASLDLNPRTQHSVADEFALVQQYLEIVQTRFGPRVSVRLQADADVRDARLPGLLLLPLVENAVRHGVERTAGPARIEVCARGEQGRLHLTVRDDVGQVQRDTREGGVGLSNTRERLRQLFGTAARVDLRPAQPAGAEVTVELALERAPQRSEPVQA